MKSFIVALALASQALAIELASQSQAELASQSLAELEGKYTITFTLADQLRRVEAPTENCCYFYTGGSLTGDRMQICGSW